MFSEMRTIANQRAQPCAAASPRPARPSRMPQSIIVQPPRRQVDGQKARLRDDVVVVLEHGDQTLEEVDDSDESNNMLAKPTHPAIERFSFIYAS